MTDRRRYTGTKTLQTAWTAVVLGAGVLASVASPGLVSGPVVLVGGGLTWIGGLVGLALVERQRWKGLVAQSAFDPGVGPNTADLQGIRHGQSVSVTADVPGLLSQAHTTVRANVEGVDASFTVRVTDARTADGDRGLTTGDDTLDERYAIEGDPENVRALLSEGVRGALLAVDLPGTFEITGEAVSFEVPFTRLRPAELDAAAEAVSVVAARIEALGRE